MAQTFSEFIFKLKTLLRQICLFFLDYKYMYLFQSYPSLKIEFKNCYVFMTFLEQGHLAKIFFRINFSLNLLSAILSMKRSYVTIAFE